MRRPRRQACAPSAAALCVAACAVGASLTPAGDGSAVGAASLPVQNCGCLGVLSLGENLGPRVQQRLRRHLKAFYAGEDGCAQGCPQESAYVVDIYLGAVADLPEALQRGREAATRLTSPEAFVVQTASLGERRIGIFGDGSASHGDAAPREVVQRGQALGAVYAAYRVLEALRFSFLHPLEGGLAPAFPPSAAELLALGLIKEIPRWPVRGMHYHTEHPLELTDVLQGLSVPFNCELSGSPCREPFETMLPEVESFFEWAVANRLNRIEWILLGTASWPDAGASPERRQRLATINNLCSDFGLACGAVVPIADLQQHGWVMVKVMRLRPDDWDTLVQQIRERVDWVVEAGFDFVSTESGLSEFTHPGGDLMLRLLDAFATHVNGTHGLEATVKVHCSTSQPLKDFVDPRPAAAGANATPAPLNFNFLPTYAHPSLGILAHTVQPYALDDKTHGVYGNSDFSDMFEYMKYEMRQGQRQVLFYGETAYWVSVDIDVPLFLPVYADRRVHDLRLLARTERELGAHMDGQVTFDSGWEWGYWVNAVAAARGSWQPHADAKDDASSVRAVLQPAFEAAFGARLAPRLVAWLSDVASAQVQLLLRTFDFDACAAGAGAGDGETCAATAEVSAGAEADASHEVASGETGLNGTAARELFSMLDEDNDGGLHYRELKQGMANLRRRGVVGWSLWASELLAGGDADKDDSVSFDEFVLMLSVHHNPTGASRALSRDQASALFRQLDVGPSPRRRDALPREGESGDGRLSLQELRQGMATMRSAGQVSRRLWASQLLAAADADGSGDVALDEFVLALEAQADTAKLVGLSYLSGWDTWADLPRLLGLPHRTQGDKVLPHEWQNPSYKGVAPLLRKLTQATRSWHLQGQEIKAEVESACGTLPRGCGAQLALVSELVDAAEITKLRAAHVQTLYAAQAPGVSVAGRETLLQRGRQLIKEAGEIVERREAQYRVPAERIAGWRVEPNEPNPTAYRFGYLHAVRSLYFWWRDQGRAEASSRPASRSPCYLNRMDPTDVALGWGKPVMERLRAVLDSMPKLAGLELGDCLAPPPSGFTFPDDL
eukprot:TRINITY_DN28919_c0_g1_i1.p1 TRINITY_DN28919_c0_g1~~TRINITY_DN28919_c0_g1_i1.p1  ORF type:complete len:1089 (+),score=259.45 TRINITY_DN28919_c0_g1_i1:60-3269(+)